MIKNLRFLMMSMLVMLGTSAFAQDAVIDFSGSEDVWGIGTTKLVEENSFTYGGYTIVLTGTTGNGYRWYDSGNIILGKQGATLQLPAFSFDVERIDVVGTSGASAQVKQNIFVGEEAVSEETTGAKDVTNMYMIAADKQTAGTVYVLKVTSAHNTQITKINIYKKGSNVKQQAGLSWGKASVTVTLGEDNVELPELSNPNNLAVSYESSNAEVATISANGVVNILAAGKTDISAIFAGDDTYEAQTAKYTLTVKEPIVKKSYVKATAVESGKNYIFVVEVEGASKSAAMITGNYGYPADADVERADDVITANAANALTIESDNNAYTIKQSDGRYWYLKGTYNSFNVDASPTEGQYFNVELQEDGTVKVTNVSNNKYLQYSTSHKSFGCYDTAQEGGLMPMLYVESADNAIQGVKVNQKSGVIYNLQGQRLQQTQKGLNIVGGKKLMVK